MLEHHYRASVFKLYGATTSSGLTPSGDAEVLQWCRAQFDQFSRAKGYEISSPTYVPPKEKPKPRAVSVSRELLEPIIATPPMPTFPRTNFDSTIWKHDLTDVGPIAVKLVQIHDPSLVKRFTREHIFFEQLIRPLVPNLIWATNIGKKYCLISRWVDATSINQMEARALAIIICPNGLYWFENQLHRICGHPEKNGVSHRDLCDTNIILSHNRVYLIDMGLAIFNG